MITQIHCCLHSTKDILWHGFPLQVEQRFADFFGLWIGHGWMDGLCTKIGFLKCVLAHVRMVTIICDPFWENLPIRTDNFFPDFDLKA